MTKVRLKTNSDKVYVSGIDEIHEFIVDNEVEQTMTLAEAISQMPTVTIGMRGLDGEYENIEFITEVHE